MWRFCLKSTIIKPQCCFVTPLVTFENIQHINSLFNLDKFVTEPHKLMQAFFIMSAVNRFSIFASIRNSQTNSWPSQNISISQGGFCYQLLVPNYSKRNLNWKIRTILVAKILICGSLNWIIHFLKVLFLWGSAKIESCIFQGLSLDAGLV